LGNLSQCMWNSHGIRVGNEDDDDSNDFTTLPSSDSGEMELCSSVINMDVMQPIPRCRMPTSNLMR